MTTAPSADTSHRLPASSSQPSSQQILPVITHQGEDTGRTVALSASLFDITPHPHIVYLDVINLGHRARQGSAKTKEKSEITASTRKILKQKGTGNARKGSRKSGILRGGGRVFGPKLRDYGFKMNKKEKKLARRSALSIKARKAQIMVVADFAFEKPATKAYLTMLRQLAIPKKKVLWVVSRPEKNLILSCRNIAGNKITTSGQLTAYDLLYATKVVFFESALSLLQTPSI